MDTVDPDRGISQPLRGRKAEHGFDLRAHIVPGARGAKFGDIGNRRQALNQSAIAVFRRGQLRPVPIPFHRNGGDMSSVSNELQILLIGRARLAIVDGKGAQNAAVLRGDGRGPASS